MNLNDLKEWMNGLPEEMLEFQVVNMENGKLTEEMDYRLDGPIISLAVDENNKEILFISDPKLNEDSEGSAPGATPDAIPGMGSPSLPTRDSVGSGDVSEPVSTKKKKRRILNYTDFSKKK